MKAKSFLLGSKVYGLAVQGVWHRNWSESRVVWPGAVQVGIASCGTDRALQPTSLISSFVLCFFSFQTLWVNVVFKLWACIQGVFPVVFS